MTTFIPPGITRLEIQQIADQRDAFEARVAELETLLSQKVRCQCGDDEVCALVRRVAELEAANAGLLQANRDCTAWFQAQQHDLEDCLKTLGEIANWGESSDPTPPEVIAQRTLNSLID